MNVVGRSRSISGASRLTEGLSVEPWTRGMEALDIVFSDV